MQQLEAEVLSHRTISGALEGTLAEAQERQSALMKRCQRAKDLHRNLTERTGGRVDMHGSMLYVWNVSNYPS